MSVSQSPLASGPSIQRVRVPTRRCVSPPPHPSSASPAPRDRPLRQQRCAAATQTGPGTHPRALSGGKLTDPGTSSWPNAPARRSKTRARASGKLANSRAPAPWPSGRQLADARSSGNRRTRPRGQPGPRAGKRRGPGEIDGPRPAPRSQAGRGPNAGSGWPAHAACRPRGHGRRPAETRRTPHRRRRPRHPSATHAGPAATEPASAASAAAAPVGERRRPERHEYDQEHTGRLFEVAVHGCNPVRGHE